MVKILAAADFHGSYDISRKLAKKAKKNNVDLVLLAGDINGHEEGKGNILGPFEKERQKVFFVPGNWDSEKEHSVLMEKAKSLHEYYVTYSGVAIAGIGCEEMAFDITDEDFDRLKRVFGRIKPQKRVLVSHLHAMGTKAEFSGVKGDKNLRRAIDELKPDIFISAHIHEAEGIEEKVKDTRVLQVGRKGKIFEI